MHPEVHRRTGKALLSGHTEVPTPSAVPAQSQLHGFPSALMSRGGKLSLKALHSLNLPSVSGQLETRTQPLPEGQLTPTSDLSCTYSKVSSSSPPCSPPASWQCPRASPFTISFLRTQANFSHHLGVPTLSSLSASSDMPAEEPAQRSRLPTSAHARAILPARESWAPEPVGYKAPSQN